MHKFQKWKKAADSGELSVTADPLAGDDDDKFALSIFSNPIVRMPGSLSAACIGIPNVEPILQHIYDEHL